MRTLFIVFAFVALYLIALLICLLCGSIVEGSFHLPTWSQDTRSGTVLTSVPVFLVLLWIVGGGEEKTG